MNLEISRTMMYMTNVNPKTENHGEEKVLATYVDLSANMPVEVLAKFSDNDQDQETKT